MITWPDAQSAEIPLATGRRCTCRALPYGIHGDENDDDDDDDVDDDDEGGGGDYDDDDDSDK